MRKYFVFFIIAWVIFIFHTIYTRHAIYGDGNGYYAYTQSLYFEKSLNFKPIFNYLQKFQGRTGEFSRLFWDTRFDPYSIGTGIVWLPSMFLMSLFSNDRFSLIYEIGPGLTGIICILLGLTVIEKYLSRHFSKQATFWTILTLFFGSNVFYYTAFEPALSHQPSFLIIALLIFLALDKDKKVNLFVVGLLSGLLANIRIGDMVLLIPILPAIKNHRFKLAYFVLGFSIAILPQLTNQAIQYHNILNNSYVDGVMGYWRFIPADIISTLFSLKRGLFTWTPVLILGIYGLIKNKNVIILITLALVWLMISFWSGGLSAGFGLGLMFSAIPYFSIGIAYVYNSLHIKKVKTFFAIFSFYNLLLILGFYLLGWKNLT